MFQSVHNWCCFRYGIVGILLLFSCGKEKDKIDPDPGSGSNTPPTTGEPTIGTLVVVNAALEAAPRVRPSNNAALNFDIDWGPTKSLYKIHNLIQEFVPERDSGKIDGSNMWSQIYNASSSLSKGYGVNCDGMTQAENTFSETLPVTIPAKHIVSPFDFETDKLFSADDTFDCKYTNDYVWNDHRYIDEIASHKSDTRLPRKIQGISLCSQRCA